MPANPDVKRTEWYGAILRIEQPHIGSRSIAEREFYTENRPPNDVLSDTVKAIAGSATDDHGKPQKGDVVVITRKHDGAVFGRVIESISYSEVTVTLA